MACLLEAVEGELTVLERFPSAHWLASDAALSTFEAWIQTASSFATVDEWFLKVAVREAAVAAGWSASTHKVEFEWPTGRINLRRGDSQARLLVGAMSGDGMWMHFGFDDRGDDPGEEPAKTANDVLQRLTDVADQLILLHTDFDQFTWELRVCDLKALAPRSNTVNWIPNGSTSTLTNAYGEPLVTIARLDDPTFVEFAVTEFFPAAFRSLVRWKLPDHR